MNEPAHVVPSLNGEIRSGALCEVIAFIGQSEMRGALVVEDGETKRSIFFEGGQVIGAESNADDDRLGDVLARAGELTPEQVTACRALTSTGQVRFGEAAVELDYLDREKLFSLMGRRIDEIFSAAIRMENGTFAFGEEFDDDSVSFRRPRPVSDHLTDSVRLVKVAHWFRARLPSLDHIPCTTDLPPPADDPLGIYQAIDGERSVADLAQATGATAEEVTREVAQLVYGGRATIRAPQLDPRRTVEIYNSAIAMLMLELDQIDRGNAVREELGSFAKQFEQLFAGGPARDGTLDAELVLQNVASAEDREDAEESLSRALYEYASYALFLSRPHFERHAKTVDSNVAGKLEAIAPARRPTMPAPSIRRASGTVKIKAFVLPAKTQKISAVTDELLARARKVAPTIAEKKIATAEPVVLAPRRLRPLRLLVPAAVVLGMIGLVVAARLSPSPKPAAVAPRTEVLLACQPECSAWVDGHRVESMNAPLAITPGDHEIFVARAGYVRETRRVTLKDGESIALSFHLTRGDGSSRDRRP